MSAQIEINGVTATIEAGEWECEDLALLEKLQQIESPSYLPDGVNARLVIEKLGGALISETVDDDGESDGLVIH